MKLSISSICGGSNRNEYVVIRWGIRLVVAEATISGNGMASQREELYKT
jgi:hypothetical protein